MPKLTSEVQFLKGVGPKRAESLADKGINTVRDVLFFFPNKYKDFTKLLAITDLSDGDEAVVRGRIIKSSRGNPFGKVRYRMTISDGTGTASAIWFKTLNGLESFRIGEEVYISGKVIYRAGFTFVHPTVERTGGETRRANRISPVYPEIDGIGEASIHNMVEQALTCAEHLNEFLPQEILLAYSFPERARALKEIHSPRTSDRLRKARQRFVFEEFFLMQVATALKRHHYRSVKKQRPMKFSTHIDSRIRARFPFSFTKAQDRAIGDIVGDMTSKVPMNRLLQGDVGSGKTAVALYAALLAVANKKQAAILVPTEVLARQHFESINEFLKGSRVRTDLVVGSMNSAERAAAHRFLARGETDIVVGTHALLTADVNFARLGLAVVDEQHRFGVAQRAGLKYKGTATDTLVMTATPIPRTLAMTLFGDLDVSVIDELPPGRKPVRTLRFPLEEERKAIALIREELSNGGQAFVISPYIEATATDDFRSALATYERFGEKIFADYSVGLVHGRMPPAKREMEMERFRRGETDVLISTVIVEVGIDMPNASVMFIQHAERFGLSTLHQLRGRVGRGKRISYCLCTADLTNDQSRERLEVFCSTTDGFRIAEEDLRLRGPGEVLGTKQHGLPALKWGSISDDYDVLKLARTEAFRLVESGWRPPDHLRAEMQRCTPSNPNYSTVG